MFEKMCTLKLSNVIRGIGLMCFLLLVGLADVQADFVFSGSMRYGCADAGRYVSAKKSSYSKGASPKAAYLNLARVLGNMGSVQTKPSPKPPTLLPSNQMMILKSRPVK